MTVVNGYCTSAQLRTHLADTNNVLTAELLDRAVNAASRAIDRHCGRRFWLDTGVATRTFMVADPSLAYIDDIGSRTGLVVKTGVDGVNFPTTLTTDTQFVLEPRNADKFASVTLDAYSFTSLRTVGSQRLYVDAWRPTLQITARFGWSSVPTDVEQACVIKAASLFNRKDAPFGVAGFGEFGVIRITRKDTDIIDLLAGYIVPVC